MRTAPLLGLLGTLIAATAAAEGPVPASFTVISPIFGQLVRFSMPSNFVGRVDASADRHGETALIIAVKGSAGYYTVLWAERTSGTARPAVEDAQWAERLRQLQPIRLCAIQPGEAAPYPSCVGKN